MSKQQQQQQAIVHHPASLGLAEEWAGKTVRIHSSCARANWGSLHVPGMIGHVFRKARHPSHNTQVEICAQVEKFSRFGVEIVPDMPGVVAFRLLLENLGADDDTKEEQEPLYLTNVMYSDEARQEVVSALASVPGLLADNIALIVDYAVGRPTQDSNFEGAGFNYSPMMVQRGASRTGTGAGAGTDGSVVPNKLQMFTLEPDIGVRSLFGTYWRCQWWNKTVSQSPHLKRDEKWVFVDWDQYEKERQEEYSAAAQVEEEEKYEETEAQKTERDAAYDTAMEQARKALGFGGPGGGAQTTSNAAFPAPTTGPTTSATSNSAFPPPTTGMFLGGSSTATATNDSAFQLGATKATIINKSSSSSRTTTTRRRQDPAARRTAAGASRKPAETPPTFSFSSGPTPPPAAPSGTFAFGSPSSTASGEWPSATTTTNGFTFGADSVAENKGETFSFGSTTPPPTAAGASTFTFGAASAEKPPGTFSFGSPASPPPPPTAGASAFTFGAASPENKAGTSTFSFGSATATPPPTTTTNGFTFGVASAAENKGGTGTFSFGSTTGPPPPTTSGASIFAFGSAAAASVETKGGASEKADDGEGEVGTT